MIADLDPRAMPAPHRAGVAPTPVVALDFADAESALALVGRLPRVEWVKVGLQLFTAAGPSIVHALRDRGLHVFLDLKLHDIPNTVAGAVRVAGALGVELLTVHASGGSAMLRAARGAAGERGAGGPRLLAVTLLTSLSHGEVAENWGRASVSPADEVNRLTEMASTAEMDGVVASVHELTSIRAAWGTDLLVLTPGIRLPGDAAGDQTRIATPAEAARLGADFLVVGRSVTAAPEPAAAYEAVLEQLARSLV